MDYIFSMPVGIRGGEEEEEIIGNNLCYLCHTIVYKRDTLNKAG